jgi:hypothetical protein
MASGGKDQHRMVFDIRGKRRNVVKVVYAVLAVLMGFSLLLVVGPVNLGEIFGNESGSSSEAVSRLEDQAVKIERKIVKEPEDEDLVLALTRNHISSANLLMEQGPNGEALPTVESRDQLEKASAAWSEYLDATNEPAAGAAQLMATALFSLAQTSNTYNEAESNISAAAEAQQIVAKQRPSLGSLSTAALYTLYTYDYAKAEKLLDEAKKLTNTKVERESLEKQFGENKKSAKKFQKEATAVKKAEKQAAKRGGASPQEALQNPLGLGGGTGLAE